MAGTHSFGEGTVVEITATPESGWYSSVAITSEKAGTANFTRTAPSGWVIGAIIGGVAAAITLRLVTRRRKVSQNQEESGN
jgi:predicted benzoate:H+ symporter BenE